MTSPLRARISSFSAVCGALFFATILQGCGPSRSTPDTALSGVPSLNLPTELSGEGYIDPIPEGLEPLIEDGVSGSVKAPIVWEAELDDDFENRVRETGKNPSTTHASVTQAKPPAPVTGPKKSPEALPPKPSYKKAVEIYVYSSNAKFKPGPVKLEHVDVYYKGERLYTWLASTACHCIVETGAGTRYRPSTPRGTFPIQRAVRRETSKIFNDARMDFALYLGFKPNSGTAIHATYGAKLKLLGKPASAGCIRLQESNAEKLFNLVMKEGMRNAQITVRDLHTKNAMYPLTP